MPVIQSFWVGVARLVGVLVVVVNPVIGMLGVSRTDITRVATLSGMARLHVVRSTLSWRRRWVVASS
jgi:hypothetical protein